MAGAGFRLPGGADRTTIIGATGSGKSTCGLWLLAYQRFDRRPWIAFDLKREVIFDHVGFPPVQGFGFDSRLPRSPGLYLISPRPGQEEEIEELLWRIWEHENIGIYIDEAFLMPNGDAYRAIIQQGRSKRIPVFSCTQRPVDIPRAVFSEANYFCVYQMVDRRDYSTVGGFVPDAEQAASLPPYHWLWYDRVNRTRLVMGPVPPPETVATLLRDRIPYRASDWHPFRWTGRNSGRPKVKLV